MTATAMPLALVRVIILPASASMAAPLGIVCAAAATGRQKAAQTTVKAGRSFEVGLIVMLRSQLIMPD
jgi:hypothetical protein